MSARSIAIALFLALNVSALAQTEPSAYESVLIPLSPRPADYPLPGAQGSLWVVDVQVYNTSHANVAFNQFGPICRVLGCNPVPTLSAQFVGPVQAPVSPEGAVFHVERLAAESVRFQARLFDLSRLTENLGTEIPVVREGQFRHGSTPFMAVPVRGDARVTLRIYDPSGGTTGERFRVRVYPEFGNTFLVERTVQLERRIPEEAGFPGHPAYGVWFGIESAPELAGETRIRIEIEPIDLDPAYWAMVSVTNNTTQMVTIISPQ